MLFSVLLALSLCACSGAASRGTVGTSTTVRATATAAPVTPTRTPGTTAAPLPPHALSARQLPREVASVDGTPVPQWLYISQVNFHLALAAMQGRQMSGPQLRALKQTALEAVIEEAVLVRYGEQHGWVPSAAALKDNYLRVIQRRGGQAASARQVSAEFLTTAQDMVVTRDHLITQRVLSHFLAALNQPVRAVQYRMVLVSTRAEALHIRALLQATSQWVTTARDFSLDATGRNAGGEQPLFIISNSAHTSRFATALRTLPPYTLSAPLPMQGRWAVVEVLQRLPDPTVLQTDLQRYRAWTVQLRLRARVTSYLPLPTPSVTSGA